MPSGKTNLDRPLLLNRKISGLSSTILHAVCVWQNCSVLVLSNLVVLQNCLYIAQLQTANWQVFYTYSYSGTRFLLYLAGIEYSILLHCYFILNFLTKQCLSHRQRKRLRCPSVWSTSGPVLSTDARRLNVICSTPKCGLVAVCDIYIYIYI